MIEQPNPKPAHGDLWADLLRATPMPRDLRILCRDRPEYERVVAEFEAERIAKRGGRP